MPSEQHCRLCDALNNPFISGEIRSCDTVIFKTTNFALIPSIGPLVCGHAMVVSRKHYFSLASMPQEAIREYEIFLKTIFQLPEICGNLLEAEHGATPECYAGGCVAHTHIHLLPNLGQHVDMFEGKLKVVGSFSKLIEIHNFDKPYILLRKNLGKITMFQADSIETQEIRRVLSTRLGQTDWDWRTNRRDELIEKTIDFWKSALANVKIS
jgi:diadenosine tetraphosphate (Ap4A) HIT family hydrolase